MLSEGTGGMVSEVKGATVSEVEGATVSEVEGATVSEVEGATVSEVEGAMVSEVEGATVSEVEGATVSEADGRASGSTTEASAVVTSPTASQPAPLPTQNPSEQVSPEPHCDSELQGERHTLESVLHLMPSFSTGRLTPVTHCAEVSAPHCEARAQAAVHTPT
jgi:hypothetical protein